MKKVLLFIVTFILLFQLSACKESHSNSGSRSSSDNDTIQCSQCGAENSDDANFCNECSAKLSSNNGQQTGSNNNSGEGSAACIECAGKGLNACAGHQCMACNGVGYSQCYLCTNGGTAYGPCGFCDNGKVDCACENGLIYFNTPYTPDSTNQGKSCNNCENGYVECPTCKGSGKSGSYTVGGFDGTAGTEVNKTCSTCRGRKTITCSSCGGDGEI